MEKNMIYDAIKNRNENDYPIITFNAGEIVLKQGQEINNILVLIEGKAYVSNISEAGDRLITNLLENMHLIGLIESLNNEVYSYSSVVAMEKLQVISIPKKTFLKEIETDIRLMSLCLDFMSSYIASTINRDHRERSESVEHNILNFFYNSCLTMDFPVEISTNKDFLADFFGINIRTLYRYLNKWEDEKILERDGQKIFITEESFEKLKKYK